MPKNKLRLDRATVSIEAKLRVRNFSVLNTPLGHQFAQNVGVQFIQSPTHSHHAVVIGIKLKAFFVKGGDLGFFPTSRNTFLTQSNVKEVGKVRNNEQSHFYCSDYLGKRISKKKLRILQNQIKKRHSSYPKIRDQARHNSETQTVKSIGSSVHTL